MPLSRASRVVHTLTRFLQNPRFARVKRPYTAADVVSKRGTIPINYPSNIIAQKAYKIFDGHFKAGTPSHTYGAYVGFGRLSSYLVLIVV